MKRLFSSSQSIDLVDLVDLLKRLLTPELRPQPKILSKATAQPPNLEPRLDLC